MSRLVIAEKPSVAQSIASVLGAGNRKDGYQHRASPLCWGRGTERTAIWKAAGIW